ncbi:MAG TPA: alkaline phosphatase family protein [Nitriliruptorales bacterium]
MRGPAYGERTLADLTSTVLARLDVAGAERRLDIELTDRVILLVLDGLGRWLLDEHAADAPWLHAHTVATLDAVFPTTTSTSLTSIGTGLVPGQHGVLGSSIAWDGAPLDLLHWCRGTWPTDFTPALDDAPPERLQPRRTAFERAEAAGVAMSVVSRPEFEHSGLTRAGLRGGRFVPVAGLEPTLDAALAAATDPRARTFVYTHHGDIDTTGHLQGPGSDAWLRELRRVDEVVSAWADRLPDGVTLLATADHGMVAPDPTGWVELDAHPDLTEGVAVIAGEARNRYVHALPGAADDVLATWREVLPDDILVRSRDQAVEAGWFGEVADDVRGRIGDVVATAVGRTNLVHARQDPLGGRLAGLHGGLSAVELEVPLIVARGGT